MFFLNVLNYRRCGVQHDASLIPKAELPAKMISGAGITMSSREIAELTGKRHTHVLADMRKMLQDLGIQPAEFSFGYKDAQGKTRVEYMFPKRETLIPVSGYNVQRLSWKAKSNYLAPAPGKAVLLDRARVESSWVRAVSQQVRGCIVSNEHVMRADLCDRAKMRPGFGCGCLWVPAFELGDIPV